MSKKNLCMLVSWGVVAAIAFFAACTPEDTAGGFGEETNALAGILVNEKGEPQANVRVFARHTKANISDLVDTTDADGKFEFSLVRQGSYGLSATKGKSAMYKRVNYYGQSMEVKARMVASTDVSGKVNLREDTLASDVVVYIPGSPWEAKTSDKGKFSFKGVPEGTYPVLAKSPDPVRFVDVFYVGTFEDGKADFNGPYPVDMIDAVMAKAAPDSANAVADSSEDSEDADVRLVNSEKSKNMLLPLSPEYGTLCLWPLDYLTEGFAGTKVSSDARGRTEGVIFYGDPELTEGVSRNAIVLKGANQYGVVENDRNALDDATEMTLEAWIDVAKLPSDSVYRRNIVGKLGFGSSGDQDVFSLSLVRGECGVKKPKLAFFIAAGSEEDSLGCENAVFSDVVETDKWMYVAVVWNGSTLSMYVDGQLVDTAKTSVKKINPSTEPIIFGKEKLNIQLDDVRLSKTVINGADVLYRYYLKGGAL
ncbi:LamG-like jellyroll fold domain-containing protein [uncultured Fibrobacter sp.]|uniref:LamG-like jellyroll fold domain-containing protein n=1 Tax=uncultured Fibrobacter sp. TaxID=261512 RepID=UPI00262B0AC1|nr:LamG-like jellyroll fold domain-containing protein [uncultured Fibrobacter sp.]